MNLDPRRLPSAVVVARSDLNSLSNTLSAPFIFRALRLPFVANNQESPDAAFYLVLSICFLLFFFFFFSMSALSRTAADLSQFNSEYHYVLVTVSLMRMFYLCHLMLDRSERSFLSFHSRLEETN